MSSSTTYPSSRSLISRYLTSNDFPIKNVYGCKLVDSGGYTSISGVYSSSDSVSSPGGRPGGGGGGNTLFFNYFSISFNLFSASMMLFVIFL
jgi:hypothetical protein